MSRLLRITRNAVAALALLVLGAVGYIATTERGARLALELAVHAADGRLAYGSVQGTLHESLEIGNLEVVQGTVAFSAETLFVRWHPRALLKGDIRVHSLRARRALLRLPAAADAPTAAPIAPTFPELPVTLLIDEFLADDVAIVQAGATHSFKRVRFALRADRDAIALADFGLGMQAHAIEVQARVENRRKLPIDARIGWRGRAAGRGGHANVTVAGPLDALTIEGAFDLEQRGRISGRADVLADAPQFSAIVEVDPFMLDDTQKTSFDLSRLEAQGTPNTVDVLFSTAVTTTSMPRREVAAEVHAVRGADDPVTASARFSWRAVAAAAGPYARVAGEGAVALDEDVVRLRHTVAAPFPVATEAVVTALWDEPVFDVVNRWQAMSVDVPAVGRVDADPGQLVLAGPLSGLKVSGDAAARLETGGLIAADWRGELTAGGFRLHAMDLSLLDGTVQLAGAADWLDTPRGTFTFSAQDLDLAALRPDLESRVALRGDGRFTAGEAGLETGVRLLDASGSWRGKPLHANAEFLSRAGVMTVRAANFKLGRNSASLHGTLDETATATFDVAFPALGEFAAGLAGALNAAGEVSGSIAKPALRATLEARGLRYQDYSANAVDGDAVLDLAGDTVAKLRLDVDDVRRGQASLGALSVAVDGTTKNHVIGLSFVTTSAQIDVSARGGWSERQWTGVFEDLRASAGMFGDWSLVAPAEVSVRNGSAGLAPLCLAFDSARACVAVTQWSAQDGEAQVDIRRLPLGLVRDFLPTTVALTGTAEADARIAKTDGAVEASGTAAVAEGVVSLAIAGGAGETLPLRGVRAAFEINPAMARVAAHADVGEWFALDADFTHSFTGDRAIGGALSARLSDLAWLGEFIPDIAGSTGGAMLSGTFGGTLEAPQVALAGQLVDGMIHMPLSGTRISALDLTLDNLGGRQLAFALEAHEGAGTVALDGEIALDAEAGWPGRVRIDGERYPVVRLPDAEADVSPEVEIEFSTRHLDVTGRVVIPRVAVSAITVPDSAVSISGDEIVVGVETGAGDDTAPRPDFIRDAVTGNVELVLGDEVGIEAAGLSSRLTGALRWAKARGEALGRGEGRISIAEGSYQAYGQNLVVERGYLIFAGAIDNPALDVRAVRPDIAVTAGIRVTGQLTAPKFQLFSRPALPDSDVLSYIITGRGFGDVNSDQAGIIARAALSLGAEQGSIVTSQVQDAFGLDEFSVSTGTTAAETSFIAGKRLSPKLSVRSDFNPFDRLWSFFVNYKLTSTWSVEAESGQRQGADLIYSFERDSLLPEGWLE